MRIALCFIFFSDYQPALSIVSFTADFSEGLCTFTYAYQNSCSLYPRCTPYFSVEHTVSPQSVVSNTSSGCSVEYTILNLMRCVSYQSTGTALLGNQRGNTVAVGTTVMQSEWDGSASRLDNMNYVTPLQCTIPYIHVNVVVVLALQCLLLHSEHHCICKAPMAAFFSGPGRFNITSVSIGADNDLINVTYMEVSHDMDTFLYQ